MSVLASAILEKQPGESDMYYVDFVNRLRWNTDDTLAETLVGQTPSVSFPAGITGANVAVNTAEIVRETPRPGRNSYYNEYIIPVGAAVQFRLSGGTDGVKYTIEVTCATTQSNTKEVDVQVQVRDQ